MGGPVMLHMHPCTISTASINQLVSLCIIVNFLQYRPTPAPAQLSQDSDLDRKSNHAPHSRNAIIILLAFTLAPASPISLCRRHEVVCTICHYHHRISSSLSWNCARSKLERTPQSGCEKAARRLEAVMLVRKTDAMVQIHLTKGNKPQIASPSPHRMPLPVYSRRRNTEDVTKATWPRNVQKKGEGIICEYDTDSISVFWVCIG